MARSPDSKTERRTPRRMDALVFRGKTALLQGQRIAANLFGPRVRQHGLGAGRSDENIIAESVTPLWTETDPAERFLIAGKLENLRRASSKLNGISVPANEIFSFWKQVGRTSRLKGYVRGRELREGCIIPSVGGGLCQLSNALYDAAHQAGFEIIERHRHTQVIPGSLAESGRDATVFWNYVDLRFKSENTFQIEIHLDPENLTVRFRGERGTSDPLGSNEVRFVSTTDPKSCATCGVGECHRAVPAASATGFGRTAFLVDEYSPEFDRYIGNTRSANDVLLLPLNGKMFRKGNYAWGTDGFASVRQSLFITAKRSFRSRRLAAQGASRQRNLLRMYEELAERYAQCLRFDTLHVVVHQNLLPFLWRNGCLGGRTFDVLMTALPMKELQATLDKAFRLHPESKTLSDFRADPGLVAAEIEALRSARTIITSHTKIASLFPRRGKLIDWKVPSAKKIDATSNSKPHLVFPSSTVGRKGCYELREAIRGLDVKLILLGSILESPDFWAGFDIEQQCDDWMIRADLVVLPAFIEHRPRRLLVAAAAGISVIASRACGIENVHGVRSIDAGDVVALREEILAVLAARLTSTPCLVEA